jgi:hypothetical protein
VPRLTQALLKEIAKDLDGVPSWSPVDRVAPTTTSAATTCSEKPSERSP